MRAAAGVKYIFVCPGGIFLHLFLVLALLSIFRVSLAGEEMNLFFSSLAGLNFLINFRTSDAEKMKENEKFTWNMRRECVSGRIKHSVRLIALIQHWDFLYHRSRKTFCRGLRRESAAAPARIFLFLLAHIQYSHHTFPMNKQIQFTRKNWLLIVDSWRWMAVN